MAAFLSTSNIRICGVILSLFFSYIAVSFHNVIGKDSILYIETAQGFLDGGLSGAMQIFRWPFYPILFGSVHKFSGIPLEISARIVDAILIAIIVDAFFRLYQETFPETRLKWVAIVTILASIGLNDYRYEIIRDWGFLAFSLRSFIYLLRTFKSPSLSNSVCWQTCIFVAFLFRIEAVVFMVFAPVILLYRKDKLGIRLTNFAIANALLVLVTTVLTSLVVYSDITENNLGRIKDIVAYTDFSKSIEMISKTTTQIEAYVIPYHGTDYAMIFLLSGVLGILFFKIFTKIGIIFSGISLLGYFRFRSSYSSQYSGVIVYFSVIAFFSVYVFAVHYMVIAGRYVLLPTILILIFISYFFENLFADYVSNKKTRSLAFLIILVIVNVSVGIFHSSNSKEHLKLLGEWTFHNIPESAKLISNDSRLYYYSGRKILYNRFKGGFLTPKWITPELLSETDYVILKLKSDNTEYNTFISSDQAQKTKELCNSKGDCAVLYKIKESIKFS